MDLTHWLTVYWAKHGIVGALAGWTVVSTVLNVLLRVVAPEELTALAEKNPNLAAVIRLIRAFGIDPVAALEAMKAYSNYSDKKDSPAESDPSKDGDKK